MKGTIALVVGWRKRTRSGATAASGYRGIHGEVATMSIPIAASDARAILKRHGIQPSPDGVTSKQSLLSTSSTATCIDLTAPSANDHPLIPMRQLPPSATLTPPGYEEPVAVMRAPVPCRQVTCGVHLPGEGLDLAVHYRAHGRDDYRLDVRTVLPASRRHRVPGPFRTGVRVVQ
jgi:hypothetical protein